MLEDGKEDNLDLTADNILEALEEETGVSEKKEEEDIPPVPKGDEEEGSPDNPIEDALEEENEEEKEEEEEKTPDAKGGKDDKHVEKEEEDSEESKDPEEDGEDYGYTLTSEIHSELGFQDKLTEEEFKEEFGEGVEGIKNYINTVIKQSSQVSHKNEEAKKYYDYISSGGDIEQLQEVIEARNDYSELSLEGEEENIDMQRDVLFNYLVEKYPTKGEEWIEQRVTRAEDAGTLYPDSIDALESLQEVYEERETQVIENQKEADKAREDQIKEYWNREEQAVNDSEEIIGVTLNDNMKSKFMEYQKSGKFQEAIRDQDKLRELQFLTMVGIEAIQRGATTRATNKLEKKLKGISQDRSSKSSTKSSTAPPREEPKESKVNPKAWKDLEL